MIIKLIETILILSFFVSNTSNELYSLMILAMVVISMGLDLILSTKSYIIVVMFLLSFLSGVVVFMCFIVKMCASMPFSSCLKYSWTKNIISVIISLMVLLNPWVPSGPPLAGHSVLKSSIEIAEVCKFDSNLISFMTMMTILFFILFSVEGIVAPKSSKFML